MASMKTLVQPMFRWMHRDIISFTEISVSFSVNISGNINPDVHLWVISLNDRERGRGGWV